MRFLNRNAMTWDDDRRAAAFVTAKDPAVLTFAKSTIGLVRGREVRAIGQSLQTALALHEALDLYGLNYVPDPTTPYTELSPIQEAWGAHEPVGLPGVSSEVALPSAETILAAYGAEVSRYVDQASFRASPSSSRDPVHRGRPSDRNPYERPAGDGLRRDARLATGSGSSMVRHSSESTEPGEPALPRPG